jgi:hypothetical protein
MERVLFAWTSHFLASLERAAGTRTPRLRHVATALVRIVLASKPPTRLSSFSLARSMRTRLTRTLRERPRAVLEFRRNRSCAM